MNPNVWDLPLDPDFHQPLTGLLYGQIRDAFQNLQRLVADMTQAELEYRGPSGQLNSPAMLINHLRLNDQLFLYLFHRQAFPEAFRRSFYAPEGGLPVVTGRPQAELLSEYAAVLQELKAHLLTLTDQDLATPFFMNERRDVTARQALWHMAEHSMLHQGHIRWLKNWARGK